MNMEIKPELSPIVDRCGLIGDIESLTLDGIRHYFGYSQDSKLILSPLFKSPDAMAAFASRYMRRPTGEHSADIWRERVDAAETCSCLGTTPVVLNTSDFVQLTVTLRLAHVANQSVSASVNEQLIALLRAAGGNPTDARLSAMLSLAQEEATSHYKGDATRWALDVVYNNQTLPAGLTYSRVVRALQRYFSRLASCAPGNWQEVFIYR